MTPDGCPALVGPDERHLLEVVLGEAVAADQRQTVARGSGDQVERRPAARVATSDLGVVAEHRRA